MAANATETQGTKVYLVDVGTDLGYDAVTKTNDPAKVKTALTTAKEIDCIIELGDIAMGTRATVEKTCINKAGLLKFFGSYSVGNITPQLLFDAADTAGQEVLKTMWKDETKKIMIISLDDQITPTTGNTTTITFTAGISSPTIGIAKDDAVMYNPTIEMMDLPVLTEAS